MPTVVDDSGASFISLEDAKDVLSIDPANTAHDRGIERVINGTLPLIENIVGPVALRTFDEWHDGGQHFIQVRRRPSTGYGTSPVLTLLAAEEYRGPTVYPLQIVQSPGQGTTYSVTIDRIGTVTRRSAGGGVIAFPAMPSSVHIVYQAGQEKVPANVYEAALEILRVNYETTQPVGHGRFAETDDLDTGPPLGFYIPRRAHELLAPTRRAPSIA